MNEQPDFSDTFWPIVDALQNHGVDLHKKGFLKTRPTIEARRERHQELASEGKTTREIAEITGTPQTTVVRDLNHNGSEDSENTEEIETDLNHNGSELEMARKREEALCEQLKIAQAPVIVPEKRYGTIVIDPPWPMKKIEREVRPNQVEFDYPTMNENALRAWRATFRRLIAEDCHVFMWTTQKFLPMALRLFEDYEIKYVLTMVWHKPGGFQPVGLPQYNCEFVIYGRVGAPKFTDTKAFNCCFEANRAEHSRKPDEFYDLVRRVTGGDRIDVFSREHRDGFDQLGNETSKFSEVA